MAKWKQGSTETNIMQSHGIGGGQRVPRKAGEVPRPPIHAVSDDGTAACGETGLKVFDYGWPPGFGTSRDQCDDCRQATND